MLALRCWSLYGRQYLRHFNELDHELETRLKKAYRPASKYMNTFSSPVMIIISEWVTLFWGSWTSWAFCWKFHLKMCLFQVYNLYCRIYFSCFDWTNNLRRRCIDCGTYSYNHSSSGSNDCFISVILTVIFLESNIKREEKSGRKWTEENTNWQCF